MAFKKVFRLPFASSMKGSFTGKFRLPSSTECSMIWATPVLFFGGVRNPM